MRMRRLYYRVSILFNQCRTNLGLTTEFEISASSAGDSVERGSPGMLRVLLLSLAEDRSKVTPASFEVNAHDLAAAGRRQAYLPAASELWTAAGKAVLIICEAPVGHGANLSGAETGSSRTSLVAGNEICGTWGWTGLVTIQRL